MKIILVAFALSPSQGSEPATGWGWTTGLAKLHEVTVISRESNRHEVESFLRACPDSNLRFRWIPTTNRKTFLGKSSAYIAWLRDAAKVCEALIAREHFDIIHLVSYGTISAPAPFWKLGPPFILGPVGGGQTIDPRFQETLGPMPIALKIRNFRIGLLPFWPSIRQTVRGASLVLVTNRETGEIAERCGCRPAMFNATGLREEVIRAEPPPKVGSKKFRMLWTGRMLYRKALPIVFHALKKTKREEITLDLVGEGPMEAKWRILVEELGLAGQVNFRGKVPFSRIFDFYDQADLFVFPSVSDSFASQLLESAARGLPILTLDHQGADVLIPDGVAWRVAVDSPRKVIEGLAEAMTLLADSPDRLSKMAHAAISYARTESWPRRIERMSALYSEIVLRGAHTN